MSNWIFVKIYFLLTFLFLFLVSMWKFIHIEFLYLIIIIFLALILPLKSIFSNYFQNISLIKKILFLIFLSAIWYYISIDITSFLIIFIYVFFIIFKINYHNLFNFWVISFCMFIISYILKFDINIYSNFYAFSFYVFSLWIIYYLINLLVKKYDFSFKNYQSLINIILIIFIILLFFSLYYIQIISLLIYILFLLLFILDKSNFWKINLNYDENNYLHISIIWLFFIIFIPIINDFLILEQKNMIFLFTFISFIILYLGFNNVLKTTKK